MAGALANSATFFAAAALAGSVLFIPRLGFARSIWLFAALLALVSVFVARRGSRTP